MFLFFSKNTALPRTISHLFLKPFQNLEKTNDPIPTKQTEKTRTDRTYFIELIQGQVSSLLRQTITGLYSTLLEHLEAYLETCRTFMM